MMKSLTVALGALTALAVTGAMTPSGQAMLGFRPSEQATTSVTVINDTPAPVIKAATTRISTFASTAPAAAPTAVQPPSARPVAAPAAAQPPAIRPVAAPAAAQVPAPPARPAPAPAAQQPPVARPAPAAQGAPSPGGMGQVANVANILLNLPQVLSQTQVRPAPAPDSETRPEAPPFIPKYFPREKKNHKVEDGDDNSPH